MFRHHFLHVRCNGILGLHRGIFVPMIPFVFALCSCLHWGMFLIFVVVTRFLWLGLLWGSESAGLFTFRAQNQKSKHFQRAKKKAMSFLRAQYTSPFGAAFDTAKGHTDPRTQPTGADSQVCFLGCGHSMRTQGSGLLLWNWFGTLILYS